MQEIYGFKTELPLGSRLGDGPRLREFEVVKSSWLTQQLLADEVMRTGRPHEWLGRLVSTVVASIGDQPVASVYEKNQSQIPAVVQKLPLVDIGFVLAVAHMHTFGPKLQLEKQKCPLCRRGGNYTLSLRQLKIDPSGLENTEEYPVALPTGWNEPPAADPRMRRDHEGKTWNRYIQRPATIADAMHHAAFLTRIHMTSFQFRVWSECTVGVESWGTEPHADPDEPAVQKAKLAELDQATLAMKRYTVIPNLDGRDHLAFRQAERKLPQVRLAIDHVCANCGEDISTSLGFDSFFPMA
jgi:hypothetical protein